MILRKVFIFTKLISFLNQSTMNKSPYPPVVRISVLISWLVICHLYIPIPKINPGTSWEMNTSISFQLTTAP